MLIHKLGAVVHLVVHDNVKVVLGGVLGHVRVSELFGGHGVGCGACLDNEREVLLLLSKKLSCTVRLVVRLPIANASRKRDVVRVALAEPRPVPTRLGIPTSGGMAERMLNSVSKPIR